MNYIYCITNQINGKRYIGKTVNSILERFLEHCRDSRKDRCNKRPLYDAMNKYGIENFIIEELELVDDETKLDEREIYWIQELQTYGSNGYNATKGGDGKVLFNYKEILELYNLGYTVSLVSLKIGCDRTTISKVLKANGIQSRNRSKIIIQYDLAGNFVLEFNSPKEAALWVCNYLGQNNRDTVRSFINKVCSKLREHAYGYKWKYKLLDSRFGD